MPCFQPCRGIPCRAVCRGNRPVCRSGLPEAGKHFVHLLLFVDVYSKSLVLLAQSRDRIYPPDTDLGTTHSCRFNSYTFVLTQKYLIPTHFSIGTYTQALESEVSAVSNPDTAGRGGCKGLIT